MNKDNPVMLSVFIEEFKELNVGDIVYLTKYGSRLYGTENKDSDWDYYGIYVPNKKALYTSNFKHTYNFTTGEQTSKNTKHDVDLKIMSIHEWFRLLKMSEIGAIEVLYSMFETQNIMVQNYIFLDEIKEKKNFDLFAELIYSSKNKIFKFFDFIFKDLEDLNTKKLLHAFRVSQYISEIFMGARKIFPIPKYTIDIIKHYEKDLSEVVVKEYISKNIAYCRWRNKKVDVESLQVKIDTLLYNIVKKLSV